MKLTIIGTGNMGGAIARALAGGTYIKSSDITCTARSVETLNRYQENFNVTTDNRKAVRDADIVVFAVKPWLMEGVVREVASDMDTQRQMVVSIAAGVTFEQLSGWLGSSSATIFRVIPNTAIEVGSGVTFVSSYNASDSQKETVVGIFGEMGYVHEVEESMMASGTALASCGIAYAMKYIKAAIEGGCELGFAEEEARDIVEHTVKGAAELLLSTGNTPQVEIEKVTTPGGMTAKGLAAMDESGFSDAVIDGLKGCLK